MEDKQFYPESGFGFIILLFLPFSVIPFIIIMTTMTTAKIDGKHMCKHKTNKKILLLSEPYLDYLCVLLEPCNTKYNSLNLRGQ